MSFYDYIDSVEVGLKKSEQYSWSTEVIKDECMMVGTDLWHTQLVGMATTIKETDSTTISSM